MSAMDKMLTRGFELMMSNEPDSAEQLRELLLESLVQKYGTGVTLPPLEPEDCCPEGSTSGKPCSTAQIPISPDSPSPSSSPPNPPLSDDSSRMSTDIGDNCRMSFTELSCIVCGLFSVGVCNQLMECNSCQNLYHQDCHNPQVKVVARSHWECSDCLETKPVQISSPTEEKAVPFLTIDDSPPAVLPAKLDHKSVYKSSSSLPHKSSTKTSSDHSSSSTRYSHHSHRSHHSRHGHSSSSSSSSSRRHSSSSSSHKHSSHHHHHQKSSSSSREPKQLN